MPFLTPPKTSPKQALMSYNLTPGKLWAENIATPIKTTNDIRVTLQNKQVSVLDQILAISTLLRKGIFKYLDLVVK